MTVYLCCTDGEIYTYHSVYDVFQSGAMIRIYGNDTDLYVFSTDDIKSLIITQDD